jgi:hypothetical protein
MKRMSEFYFDVSKWEEDLAAQQEDESGSGKKRKRPTKKDLVSRPSDFYDTTLTCLLFRRDSRSRKD